MLASSTEVGFGNMNVLNNGLRAEVKHQFQVTEYFCSLLEILSCGMRRVLPGPRVNIHEVHLNECPAKPSRATVNMQTYEGEIDLVVELITEM